MVTPDRNRNDAVANQLPQYNGPGWSDKGLVGGVGIRHVVFALVSRNCVHEPFLMVCAVLV